MIHILHALPDSGIGGAGKLLEALLAYTDSSRFRVTAVFPRESRTAAAAAALGARVLLLDTPPDVGFSLRRLPSLIRLVGELSPHIVHTHGWFDMRLAAALALTPLCVSTKHCATAPPKHPQLYRAATDVTVTTSQEAHRLLRSAGIPEEELSLIGNSPLLPELPPPAARQALRKKYGMKDGEFAVGLCARLDPIKGHRTLLQAADLLKGAPFRFLLLGDGPLRPTLKAQIERLGLRDRVLLLGAWQDPAPFYSILDASVNCSLGSETSSLALSEGLHFGLPTAASDIPGNRALLDGCGILFPPGNAEALATALCRLKTHQQLYSSSSRRRSAERPSAKEMCKAYEQLYLSRLSTGKKRRSFSTTL